VHYTGPLRAPVTKGAEVAQLKVYRGDKVALEVPLYAAEGVQTGTLVQRALDSTSELAVGWIRTGINTVLKK
jgi:D-alanyl-D-alanine carboxypeptidase (penicillin-binding protein 5/6)